MQKKELLDALRAIRSLFWERDNHGARMALEELLKRVDGEAGEMGFVAPGDVVLTCGPHEGLTLGQVAGVAPDYLDVLLRDRDASPWLRYAAGEVVLGTRIKK